MGRCVIKLVLVSGHFTVSVMGLTEPKTDTPVNYDYFPYALPACQGVKRKKNCYT